MISSHLLYPLSYPRSRSKRFTASSRPSFSGTRQPQSGPRQPGSQRARTMAERREALMIEAKSREFQALSACAVKKATKHEQRKRSRRSRNGYRARDAEHVVFVSESKPARKANDHEREGARTSGVTHSARGRPKRRSLAASTSLVCIMRGNVSKGSARIGMSKTRAHLHRHRRLDLRALARGVLSGRACRTRRSSTTPAGT